MVELWLSLRGHLPQMHLSECTRAAVFVPKVPDTETQTGFHTDQPRNQEGKAVQRLPGALSSFAVTISFLFFSFLFFLKRCIYVLYVSTL